MAKHFSINIRVAFEDGTTPTDMAAQLRKNVDKAVQGALLNDQDLESIVEDYSVDVEEYR